MAENLESAWRAEPCPVSALCSRPVNDGVSMSWKLGSACQTRGDSSKDINIALLTNSLILT